MGDVVISALVVAGALALLVVPLVVLEIVRLGRVNRGLTERNAAQAVTIARLEWPLSVGKAPDQGYPPQEVPKPMAWAIDGEGFPSRPKRRTRK